MKHTYLLIKVLLLVTILSACKKGFLEQKQDMALLVPTTLADMQTLLDNVGIMNQSPILPELAADDFQTSTAALQTFSAVLRNTYTWQADLFEGSANPTDWAVLYQQVFYANVVLDGMDKISTNAANQQEWNAIKGAGLFFRSHAYYHLLGEFAKPYHAPTAGTDLGLPIRLTADVNDWPARPGLQQNYDQLIDDLKAAAELLPLTVSYKNRPSRAAALGMLARIYLEMGDYPNTLSYAEEALKINAKLIDYNIISANPTSGIRPFPIVLPNQNDEVIFYSAMPSNSYQSGAVGSLTTADPKLLQSYESSDLRRTLYFVNRTSGMVNFKGSYSGALSGSSFFSGVATDELYLIRAEAHARLNDKDKALADLNSLLIKRYKTGTFSPRTAENAETALKLVLTERRKELVGRGMRWRELRRLNLEERFAVTLAKSYNNENITLLPNAIRYIFPIPDAEVSLMGLVQNER